MELVVVAVIVFVIFSTVRISPRTRSGVAQAEDERQPARTPGGRLTFGKPASSRTEFDEAEAPVLFGFMAFLSLVVIALATWAATHWWDGTHHYQPAYVLYGLLGLLWIVIPSTLAFVLAKDMPFPTLYRTITNLEDWLRARAWRWSLGPILAWLVSYVILAGLVILLLHLTLYPYPNITKILNPTG